jgi:SAM-dependent methyltransferase
MRGGEPVRQDWLGGFAEPMLTTALDWLFPSDAAGGILLDVGCSGGNRHESGGRASFSVGVDIDLPALYGAAARHPGTVFEAADACSLPFRDGSFTALLSFGTMQYVDRNRALLEARRVLAGGGRAAVAENNRSYPASIAWRALRHSPDRRSRHFAPGDLALYRRLFTVVEVVGFHLISPLAMLPVALGHLLTRKPIRMPSRRLLRLLGAADRLLAGSDKARTAGWMTLLLLSREGAA